MIKANRATCTAYRVNLQGCAVEYLCDPGTTLETTTEVELWIEVGDQAGFNPYDWPTTGAGDVGALVKIARELRATLPQINAPVVAVPGCERNARAYRWLCRLGFEWCNGYRAATDEVYDAFVRPAHSSA